jgi:hypothetical protein
MRGKLLTKQKHPTAAFTGRETATDKLRLKDNFDNKAAVPRSHPLNCWAVQ